MGRLHGDRDGRDNEEYDCAVLQPPGRDGLVSSRFQEEERRVTRDDRCKHRGDERQIRGRKEEHDREAAYDAAAIPPPRTQGRDQIPTNAATTDSTQAIIIWTMRRSSSLFGLRPSAFNDANRSIHATK